MNLATRSPRHSKRAARFNGRLPGQTSCCVFFCKELEEYAALMERTLRQLSPGEPLGLLLYNDEVTPGNVLAPDNKRKFNSFYFAFMKTGAAAHQNDRSSGAEGVL